jgi:uncharacterized SAM-binding protein YcdF (DUF218 family)
VITDALERADAIVILGGDLVTRCQAAARLFSQGWASRMWVTKGPYRDEQEVLKQYGIAELEAHEKCLAILTFHAVPDRAVTILDGYNGSTIDEVEKVRDYLQLQGLKRVIVVTSNFHTRRVRMLFRRVLRGKGMEVLVQPAPPNVLFDPKEWWTRRRDSKTLLWEYQKLFFYMLAY